MRHWKRLYRLLGMGDKPWLTIPSSAAAQ